MENTNNTTELIFILDKSGSMAGMEQDTIGGFNATIEKQKQLEGNAYVSTYLFSNDAVLVHDRVDLKEIRPLTPKEYTVGGCTALLDTIGEAVEHIEKIHKYARPEDVPAHTMFLITTDGYENASVKYSAKKIKALLEQKQKDGWEFIFVAANINVEETVEELGIKRSRAASYQQTKKGTKKMYDALNQTICCMRCEILDEDFDMQKEIDR